MKPLRRTPASYRYRAANNEACMQICRLKIAVVSDNCRSRTWRVSHRTCAAMRFHPAACRAIVAKRLSAEQRQAIWGVSLGAKRAVVKLSNRDCVSLTSTRQRAGVREP
jgi:hypothetical protein